MCRRASSNCRSSPPAGRRSRRGSLEVRFSGSPGATARASRGPRGRHRAGIAHSASGRAPSRPRGIAGAATCRPPVAASLVSAAFLAREEVGEDDVRARQPASSPSSPTRRSRSRPSTRERQCRSFRVPVHLDPWPWIVTRHSTPRSPSARARSRAAASTALASSTLPVTNSAYPAPAVKRGRPALRRRECRRATEQVDRRRHVAALEGLLPGAGESLDGLVRDVELVRTDWPSSARNETVLEVKPTTLECRRAGLGGMVRQSANRS